MNISDIFSLANLMHHQESESFVPLGEVFIQICSFQQRKSGFSKSRPVFSMKKKESELHARVAGIFNQILRQIGQILTISYSEKMKKTMEKMRKSPPRMFSRTRVPSS